MASLDSTDVTAPDGTRIRRWERAPAAATEAVVFVHGATYGGRSAFDPEGVSWLAAVARAGRAAYAVDVRGYGDSGHPPELDAPAGEHDPVVRASTAAGDVAAALDDVCEAYETVHLVGYSWGTIISGHVLTEQRDDLASLVQYAPVYRPPEASREEFATPERLAAYRTVTRAEARERWADQRPDDAPEEAFAAFWDALVASDQRVDDDVIRAPNGTYADLRAAIDAPPYDPGAIDLPTLVVRGSLDTASTRPDALALYDDLAAPDRTYAEVSGGTHFLQFEPRREALYGTVRSFHDRIGGD
ncbi:MAG: alpha/beta hydrolase [Haloarculaceae archaeon]